MSYLYLKKIIFSFYCSELAALFGLPAHWSVLLLHTAWFWTPLFFSSVICQLCSICFVPSYVFCPLLKFSLYLCHLLPSLLSIPVTTAFNFLSIFLLLISASRFFWDFFFLLERYSFPLFCLILCFFVYILGKIAICLILERVTLCKR